MELIKVYKLKTTRKARSNREFLKSLVFTGLILAGGIAIIKTFEFYYFTYRISSEIYIAILSIIFMGIGIYLGLKFAKKRPAKFEISEPVNLPLNMELSKREMEILSHLSSGNSNQEIADILYISLNTVKTHTNHIYSKLNVKRRAQALETARKLNLIR